MRETVLSNCEKTFVEKAVLEGLRVDKRDLDEFRALGVYFGIEYGSVVCSLGDTKVFAKVSCEVSTPKPTRPNEGTLFINVEIGPMAAPHFEAGFSMNETGIQVNRILEKTLRESKCIDLESLCIIAEEKVWNLRVDIAILNTDGNLIDCACIAAVCSLAHFKRPDVTTTGDGEFIIHTPAEKDLIPIVLHHYPISVTFGIFAEGSIPVADPTALEERVANGSLVLAVNSYREICCMHLIGVVLTSPRLIMKCSEVAADRARRIVEFIKATLAEDEEERAKGEKTALGFAEFIKTSNIRGNFRAEEAVEGMKEGCDERNFDEDEEESEDEPKIVKIDQKTAASGEWEKEDGSGSEESSEDEKMGEVVAPVSKKSTSGGKKTEVVTIDDGDSSEEETVVLQ